MKDDFMTIMRYGIGESSIALYYAVNEYVPRPDSDPSVTVVEVHCETPLTEKDLRRIIREEIEQAEKNRKIYVNVYMDDKDKPAAKRIREVTE